MELIKMVDLKGQHDILKEKLETAIFDVIENSAFINGPSVKSFSENMTRYLKVRHVIPCGNGTDALELALMALNLKKGDEVIVPDFSFVAPAEAVAHLGLTPVFADVDPDTFNITAETIQPFITAKTKAIIPVHLFGQPAEMENIILLAKKYNLFLIEDNAQSFGSDITFSDGQVKKAGTVGDIGTTSFFPSKNLGCMGDGGAIFTNNDVLAERLKMFGNHGQKKKYHHELIGINSRLDSIQAAILDIKLNHLDEFIRRRKNAAATYDRLLTPLTKIQLPFITKGKDHTFNQYTIQVPVELRDKLHLHLKNNGIPSMIYYPVPLNIQPAFSSFQKNIVPWVSNELCNKVLSLPMHTELSLEQIEYICKKISGFFY